jgi:hypothetical protein
VTGQDHPDEVAFDLGWSDGFDGRPMREDDIFTVQEHRAYLDGYRLGERHRGEPGYGEFPGADQVILLARRTKPGRFVACVVAAVAVVLVLLVIFK